MTALVVTASVDSPPHPVWEVGQGWQICGGALQHWAGLAYSVKQLSRDSMGNQGSGKKGGMSSFRNRICLNQNTFCTSSQHIVCTFSTYSNIRTNIILTSPIIPIQPYPTYSNIFRKCRPDWPATLCRFSLGKYKHDL